MLNLFHEYLLQCLLVAEEAVWCKVVLLAIQESQRSPVKLSKIKANSSEKLKSLGYIIRNGLTEAKNESLNMLCVCVL